MPLPEGIVVETNFLLDIVYDQYPPANDLLALAESGTVVMFVPAVCIGECIKALERRQMDWRGVSESLRQLVPDFNRTPATQSLGAPLEELSLTLARVEDHFTTSLWETLERVTATAATLDLTAEAVRLARDVTDQLKRSLADAAVLATMVVHKGRCSSFSSRDRRAFDTPSAREYLKQANVTYYSDPSQFIQRLKLK